MCFEWLSTFLTLLDVFKHIHYLYTPHGKCPYCEILQRTRNFRGESMIVVFLPAYLTCIETIL